MKTIKLSGEDWKSKGDFYDALIAAHGGYKGYARNINALMELIVWDHHKPVDPYVIQISNVSSLPEDVQEEVRFVQQTLAEARTECRVRKGFDIAASIEIAS